MTSQFDKNDKSIQALASRNTALNKEIGDAEKRTGELGKALDEAGKELGGTGKETKKLGAEMDDTGKKTSTFGEVLKANLASEAIKADLSAIVNMVKAVGRAVKDYGSSAYLEITTSFRLPRKSSPSTVSTDPSSLMTNWMSSLSITHASPRPEAPGKMPSRSMSYAVSPSPYSD